MFKNRYIECVTNYNLEISKKMNNIKCTRVMLDKCISSGCFVFLENAFKLRYVRVIRLGTMNILSNIYLMRQFYLRIHV